MVILMSDKKPLNAMYGQKMKLDLDKIRNRKSKTEETSKEVTEESVVEKVASKPVVEEPVVEEVAEEPVVEEPVEEAGDDAYEDDVEEVINEPVVEEVIDDPVVDGVIDDVEEEKASQTADSKKIDDLKNKIKEKDKKLSKSEIEELKDILRDE